jgi:hypothetical protein
VRVEGREGKNPPQDPGLPGMSSNQRSMKMSSIWILVVVTAVARHGNLVGTQVVVQSPLPRPGAVIVQPVKLALVIVKTAALVTVVASDVLLHNEVIPPKLGEVYPRLLEVSV